MPEIQEKTRWWSHARQRLGDRRATDAGQALRDVVGVYSSHPTAPLSLHARVRSFDGGLLRHLEHERAALRLPTMRGSIYILPRETAYLAFRALPEPPARQAQRLRYSGLSDDRYAELHDRVLAAAREPRTARELRDAIGAERALTPVLSAMTREGVLLRVGAEGLRSNQLRYVATDAWLGPDGLPHADPDEALAWLAGEYLRAFGPARPEDFRWWAGVKGERASVALSAVETVEVGDGCQLPAGDVEAFEAARAPAGGSVDLLPKWDCYTMGYAPDGRRRFVHPDVQDRVYTPAGDGLGVVLVDGAAAGAWEARFEGRRMVVDLDVFERPGKRLREAIRERFEAVAALLGARTLSLD